MRQKTLDVLEFEKIKSFVADETISDLGREKVQEGQHRRRFKCGRIKQN